MDFLELFCPVATECQCYISLVSVKAFNGHNAGIVPNGVKFRAMLLFHQGGHALETYGILRGKDILRPMT